MQYEQPSASVVVGIDGSSAAVHAAIWAVDEAVSRDIPLRLIHVIQSTATDIHRETDHAEAILRAAHAAVRQTGQPVKIETAVMRGPVAATLVAESTEAAMVCVGSAGSERQASKSIGAIGSAVAHSALCPVAIIRTRDDDAPRPMSGDIAVVIDDSRDVEFVLQVAMEEAHLRNATLLVLNVTSSRIRELAPEEVDRHLAEWLGRHPEVPAHVLMAPDDLPVFLTAHDTPVQLTVIANGDASARLVGPYGRFVLRDTGCSVLLVRPRG
jgi:nucleotide-binding universal stress UspA family protein